MRTWARRCIVCAVWIGALALPAMAFVPRVGKTVVVSEALQDDLYLAGGTVTATAAVDGDVVAAGGTVDLAGEVTGDVLAAGGTITASGAIGRSLRAAGGTVTIESRIKSDAVLVGGAVHVNPAAQIARDLVVSGGTVNVSGTVGRRVFIDGGDVVLGGAIQGNADIQASRIVLLPTARIGGALRYSADQPIEVQPGAKIAGGTMQFPATSRPRMVVAYPFSRAFWLWRRVAELIAVLVLGVVTFAVAPRGASAVIQQVGDRFWRNVLMGFVLLVTVPAAAFLLLFTIVGIPLAVIGMLLYLASIFPGEVFVAGWVGYAILFGLRRAPGRGPSLFWSLLVGAIVLMILFAIPYVGWAVRLVMLFAGFGALWVTVWAAGTSRPTAAQAQPASVPSHTEEYSPTEDTPPTEESSPTEESTP
jgi:hypothetical protein